MGSSLVYVSNLPFDVRERDLDDIFYKYGRIRSINIKMGNRRELPPFAFVEFGDPRDAQDAVRGRDGYDYYGNRLRVEIARGPRAAAGGSRAPGTGYRVTVEGLPPTASWQDVKDFIRRAVLPAFTEVTRDRGGRATGIVEFDSADDMDRAIRKLDDTEFTSRFESGCYVRLREDRGGQGRRGHGGSKSRSPVGRRGGGGKDRERSWSASPRRSPPRGHSRSRSPSPDRGRSPSPAPPNDDGEAGKDK